MRHFGPTAVAATTVALTLPALSVGFAPSSRPFTARFSETAAFSLQSRGAFEDEEQDDVDPSNQVTPIGPTRRTFLASAGALSLAGLSSPHPSFAEEQKVLVLGGRGFVGSRVCDLLRDRGVSVIATSRRGLFRTEAFDVLDTSVDVAKRVASLAKGCTAVISTIGSIATKDDKRVNAASGLAAVGAKEAGVKNFVYISNAPEVREVAKGISFLADYMEGKASSEAFVKSNFGGDGRSYTLIQPTFIYGGNRFGLNPPRVAAGYGRTIESILSSAPFRLAARVAPGFIGVALEPPVSVDAVAGAAVAGALYGASGELDTYDKILEASKMIKN